MSEETINQLSKQLGLSKPFVSTYLQSAQKFFEDMQKPKSAANRLKANIKSVELRQPQYHDIPVAYDSLIEKEKQGLKLLEGTGFILVAGGVSERLGSSEPRILTDIAKFGYWSKPHTLLDSLIGGIADLIELARADPDTQKSFDANRCPIFIMTSAQTDIPIKAALEQKDYYGLDRRNFYIVKQPGVPCFDKLEPVPAVDPKTNTVITKPGGHGYVHYCFYDSDTAAKWKTHHKVERVFFLQDCCSLLPNAILPMLAVSNEQKLDMNFLMVDKLPGEEAGSMVEVRDKSKQETDFKAMLVEYCNLEDLKQNACLDSVSEFSKLKSNTNMFLFNYDTYYEILTSPDFKLPYICNFKYTDNTKTKLKSPGRLEMLMQDISACLKPKSKLAATTMPRYYVFNPIKYPDSLSVERLRKGLNPDSPEFAAKVHKNVCISKLSEHFAACNGIQVNQTTLLMNNPCYPKIDFPLYTHDMKNIQFPSMYAYKFDKFSKRALDLLKVSLSFCTLFCDYRSDATKRNWNQSP